MRIGAFNASSAYNLGLAKITTHHRRRGDQVLPLSPLLAQAEIDKAYLSAIFTWYLPRLVSVAVYLKAAGVEVEIGGPAATVMAEWITAQTGIVPHRGLDGRFDQEPGEYPVTFTSRGCPNRCGYCAVPVLEPERVEYDEWPPAPVILDNNILATSWAHQERVVQRLAEARYHRLDFNSGFEARLFTEEHYALYGRLSLRFWRFAFDREAEADQVERAIGILRRRGVQYRDIIVYALIGYGSDTPVAAQGRLQRIVDWGASPWPMRYRPLSLERGYYVPPGWTREQLMALARFYGRAPIWRNTTWEEYRHAT